MIVRVKWITVLIISIILSCVLTACGSGSTPETEGDGLSAGVAEAQGGIMVTSNFADATILNPILAPDAASYTVVNNPLLPMM